MFVFPALWYSALVAGLIYLTIRFGHFPDLRRLGVFGIALLALTVFIGWVSTRTKRVGVLDGQLVLSNYRRTIYVPFRQVEAVELVWWYWRRLVRVRLRGTTDFGTIVYYNPKWAGFVWPFVDPAEKLREMISEHEALAPWHFR